MRVMHGTCILLCGGFDSIGKHPCTSWARAGRHTQLSADTEGGKVEKEPAKAVAARRNGNSAADEVEAEEPSGKGTNAKPKRSRKRKGAAEGSSDPSVSAVGTDATPKTSNEQKKRARKSAGRKASAHGKQ